MKKSLLLVALCFLYQSILANAVYPPSVNQQHLDHYIRESLDLKFDDYYEIVEHTESCTIVHVYDSEKQTWVFQVIAAVLTSLLPEVARGICKRTIDNPDVCESVYQVTYALVSLRGILGKATSAGRSGSLGWKALKKDTKSRAIIKDIASDYVVDAVKTVFKSYEEECQANQGIPWESVETSEGVENIPLINMGNKDARSTSEYLQIANHTANNLVFMWKTVNPNEEPYDWKIDDWNTVEISSYTLKPIFSTENADGLYYVCIHSGTHILYYTLYGNNRYEFKWNNNLQRWELGEF